VRARVLCRFDAVPDGDCLEVVHGGKSLVLMRSADRVWAYINVCPHFSLPLNAQSNAFLVIGARQVMCAYHCAVFRFEDGVCIEGPAVGLKLDAVSIEIADGEICLRDQ
jgi:nitrite reductase/ring-hydroxylating ferredoxin subunit